MPPKGGGTEIFMARKITTRAEIIKCAAERYLETGYTDTSIKSICDRIGISTGNLTFYFPSKEHLLDILVDMLCDFQWELMKTTVKEGNSSIMAYCLELITMAAACEQNSIIKDFFLSSYKHQMSLDTIRRNDTRKTKMVFKDYTEGWDEMHYSEAETLVSGIEYATLMTTSDSAGLEVRIVGALRTILGIYGVPKEISAQKIQKVVALDYMEMGEKTLREFREFIYNLDDEYIEDAYVKYCARVNR